MTSVVDHRISHILTLLSNAREVERLLEIHEELTGSGPGRRAGVEVLNKSGVVLLVACWETFIEDLLKNAATELAASAAGVDEIPARVRAGIGESLSEQKDKKAPWKLAGNGWRQVIRDRAEKLASSLNTPRAKNIDPLFEKALGLLDLSKSWYWSGMSADGAQRKLGRLITRRGSIAHTVATAESVKKADVDSHADFIYRLAVRSHSKVGAFLTDQAPASTWPTVSYDGKWRAT